MREFEIDWLNRLSASAENAKDYTFYLVLDKPAYTAEAFQQNPDCAAAADVLFKSPVLPDQGGRASVDVAPERKAVTDKLKDGANQAKAVVVATSRPGSKEPEKRLAVVEPCTIRKKPRGEVILLLRPQGADFVDASPLRHAIGRNSLALSSEKLTGKFGGETPKLLGGWILIGHGGGWLGTEDFTLDFWLCLSEAKDEYLVFGFGSAQYALDFVFWVGPDKVKSRDPSLQYPQRRQAGEWHHFAFARKSGTIKLFEDGVERTSGAFGGAIGHGHVHIGGMIGLIDEFRIMKGSAEYWDNFTPPSRRYEV